MPAALVMDAAPMAHTASWQLAEAPSFPSSPFRKNDKLWNNSIFEPAPSSTPRPDSPVEASVLKNELTDDASTSRDSGEGSSPQQQQQQQRSPLAAHSRAAATSTPQSTASPRALQQVSPSGGSIFKSRGLLKHLTAAARPASPKPSTPKPSIDQDQISSPVIPFHQAFPFEEEAPTASPRPSAYPCTPEELIVSWEQELRRMITAGNMLDEALDRPAPSAGMVRCSVRRNKAFLSSNCVFQLHLQCSNQLLLAARKRKKSKVSSYVMSTDADDLKRDSSSCIAKLKANFVGTEYMLWGRGKDKAVKKGFGSEQLCLSFKPSSMEGGPHAMHAVLPVPEGEWRPELGDRGSGSGTGAAASTAPSQLSGLLEQAKQRDLGPTAEQQLSLLCTKPPEYDEVQKEFFLDFGGRVKQHSVKNMQLVCWDHNTDTVGSQVILQFGKVSDDHYILDFAYPLSVKTAFALALAKIDTKLCYMLG